MTQLDVPNISFTHYLDLLKRRTWHVIIVSVLGLIVGGVVAMLIPRYYVATTTVELKRPVLDPELGTPVDLMSQVITAAIHTVPRGVDTAVRELGWTEAFSGSLNDRRAFLKAIKARVGVHDTGPRNPNRRMAVLMISYRDLSGDRAAAMANLLRDIWLKEFLDELRSEAKAELSAVIQRRSTLLAEKKRVTKELQVYEQDNQINPADWNGQRGDAAVLSLVTRNINTQVKEIQLLKLKIQSLDRMIRTRDAEKDGVSETLPMTVEQLLTNPAMRKEYATLTLTVIYTTRKLGNLKPANDQYASTERTMKSALSRLDELRKLAGGQATEKPNPAYQNLVREIRGLKSEKVDDEQKLIGLDARLAALNDRAAKLPGINGGYRELREKLENLREQEKTQLADLESKTRSVERIQTDRPYRKLEPAYIPPAPTEPNPYMLAMMGCLVGLGLAIALVLLIDFLQMSFKSVADVESGLGLPVLGTMSYLETNEEAVSTRGRRTRVTVFAVAFLVLLLTVVTIYYVSPTSLPEYVTDFLDLILKEKR